MKNQLTIACFLLLLFTSCKKEEVSQSITATASGNVLKNEDQYLKNVKKYLRSNLSGKILNN
jgi:hypothetical protein